MDQRACHPEAARRTAAFTLVEVLVSISVIAVLLSIAIPAIRSARSHAESTACQVRLGDILKLHAAYSASHDGRWANDFEPGTVVAFWGKFVTDGDWSTISVNAYATILQVGTWPGPLRTGGVVNADDPPEGFACPAVNRDWNRPGLPRGLVDLARLSYFYSPALFTKPSLWSSNLPLARRLPDAFRRSVKIDEVSHPSQKVAMFEQADHHGTRLELLLPDPPATPSEWAATKVNAGFCDGHVDRVAPSRAHPPVPLPISVWFDRPTPGSPGEVALPFGSAERGFRGRDFD